MPENPTPDPTQSSLIQRAIQGDAQAVQNVLQYLNAASPDLRHIIQAQLHQSGDTRIWQHLLYCLGHGCWQIDETPSPNLPHSETSQRGFQTIVEVFVIDENEQEAADKMQVLRSALSDPDADLRIAAAYLLGLRGEIDALPLLEAMLQSPGLEWQLRAAQALAALNDECCGAPLVAALAAGRGTPLHHAAGKALSELGICAEPALLQALHHPDNHVRWHAARLLGQIGDPRGGCAGHRAVGRGPAGALGDRQGARQPGYAGSSGNFGSTQPPAADRGVPPGGFPCLTFHDQSGDASVPAAAAAGAWQPGNPQRSPTRSHSSFWQAGAAMFRKRRNAICKNSLPETSLRNNLIRQGFDFL